MHLLKLLESQQRKRAVGTLTLGKRRCFREVFFEQDSLYLVGQQFTGKVALDALSRLGIPGARAPFEDFAKVIEKADLASQLLAEAMLEAGWIDRQEFQTVVLEQLAEEMLSLFAPNPASFHFQEGRVPEYLLQCEHLVSRTPLPLHDIIERLRSRTDQQARFEQILPSGEEIFVFTEKGLSLKQQGYPNASLYFVLDLVDGFRDLQTILRDTILYEFLARSVIVDALEQGQIKKTLFPELRAASTQNLSAPEIAKLLPFFENAVKHGVDELAARERLAALHEKAGRQEDAFLQYCRVGDVFQSVGKPAKAVRAYEHALRLRPFQSEVQDKVCAIYSQAAADELAHGNVTQATQLLESALRARSDNLEVFDRLLELLVRESKIREVSNLCDWLVAQARRDNDVDLAIAVCRRVVAAIPANALFRKKLVNLLLDTGHARDAVQELERLAEHYLSTGQGAKAREIAGKIGRIGGGDRLAAIESKIVARPKRRWLTRKVPRLRQLVVLLLVVLFGYQSIGFAFWLRLSRKSALALTVSKDQDSGVSPLRTTAEERAQRELASSCAQFLRHFPAHILRPRVSALREEAESRLQGIDRRRDQAIDLALSRAKRAFAEGERDETIGVLSPLLELDEGHPRRAEAVRLQERARSMTRSARDLLREAREAEALATRTGSLESWEATTAAYRRLIQVYPKSVLAAELEVPLWIDSVPRGAELLEIVPVGEPRFLGTTPCVLRLAPGEAVDIKLSAEGFTPVRGHVSESTATSERFWLPRLPDLTFEIAGPVDHAPAFAGRWMVFGTTEGALSCVDAETGRVVWTWLPPGGPLNRILARPVVASEAVFTVWSDRHLVRLSPVVPESEGGVAATRPESSRVPLGGLPSTTLETCADAALLAVGTTASQLEVYDCGSLALRHRVDLGEPPSAIAALGAVGVVVGTRSGGLLRVDLTTGGVDELARFADSPILELTHAARRVVARTEANRLLVLHEDGTADRALAHAAFPAYRAIRLLTESGQVCGLLPDGRLRVTSLETGESSTRGLPPGATDLLALPRGLAVALDGGRGLLVLGEADLEPVWVTRLDGVVTAVSRSESRLVAATTESAPGGTTVHELHAFRMRP